MLTPQSSEAPKSLGMPIPNLVPSVQVQLAPNDPNFPGSVMIGMEMEDGTKKRYALRQIGNNIEGNVMTLNSEWGVGPVYQLHPSDLAELEESWAMDVFRNETEAASLRAALLIRDEIKTDLMRLFIAANGFDPFTGSFPKKEEFDIPALADRIRSLETRVQKDLAEYFFENTIGKSIHNNIHAYRVYALLRWTDFSSQFASLEDRRLKDVGYSGGFIL